MKHKINFCLAALLPIIFLFLQGAGCPKDKPGVADTNNENIAPKVCLDLTTKSDCEKPDAINGKVCVFMADRCVEDTQERRDFMSEERSFTTNLEEKTDGYGLDHGETMNWAALCGQPIIQDFPPLPNVLKSITFKFIKDEALVDLILDCKGKTEKNTHQLSYSANTLNDKALLLKLSLHGKSVMAKTSLQGALESNQLEFFTKPNWFFANSITGISLLHDVGFTHYGRIDLETTQQLDAAMTYITGAGNGYEAAANVGAITLILNP